MATITEILDDLRAADEIIQVELGRQIKDRDPSSQ